MDAAEQSAMFRTTLRNTELSGLKRQQYWKLRNPDLKKLTSISVHLKVLCHFESSTFILHLYVISNYTSGQVPACDLVHLNQCFSDYWVKGQYFLFVFNLLETDACEKYVIDEILKSEIKQQSHEQYKPLIRHSDVVAISNCCNSLYFFSVSEFICCCSMRNSSKTGPGPLLIWLRI